VMNQDGGFAELMTSGKRGDRFHVVFFMFVCGSVCMPWEHGGLGNGERRGASKVGKATPGKEKDQ